MAGGIVIERRDSTAAPALAIGGRFKGFLPEEERAVGKAEVKETGVLRQMKAAWRSWDYDNAENPRNFEIDYFETDYQAALRIAACIKYDAKDVEGFSLALEEFQDEDNFSVKAGLFLSALINNGNGSHYIIRTQHLSAPLRLLGCVNVKSIVVDGDAGNNVGQKMRDGSIEVRGNAIDSVGWEMEGGSIIIHGDVGYRTGSDMEGGSISVGGDAIEAVGWGMKGGSISIKGNAGSNVGCFMKGGEIQLLGDYELSGWTTGGMIYHRGRLIWPRQSI